MYEVHLDENSKNSSSVVFCCFFQSENCSDENFNLTSLDEAKDLSEDFKVEVLKRQSLCEKSDECFLGYANESWKFLEVKTLKCDRGHTD